MLSVGTSAPFAIGYDEKPSGQTLPVSCAAARAFLALCCNFHREILCEVGISLRKHEGEPKLAFQNR